MTWTPHDGDSRCEGWAPDVTSLCLSVQALGSHFLRFPGVCCREGAVRVASKPLGTLATLSPGWPNQVPPIPRVVPWELEGCGWGPMAIHLEHHVGRHSGEGFQAGWAVLLGEVGMSLTLTWRGVRNHLFWGAWSQEGSISLTGRPRHGGGLWWEGSVGALREVSQLHLSPTRSLFPPRTRPALVWLSFCPPAGQVTAASEEEGADR